MCDKIKFWKIKFRKENQKKEKMNVKTKKRNGLTIFINWFFENKKEKLW